MSQFVWTSPGGKISDNFETLGAVSSKTWTVPAGKRWVIYGGSAERDQNATLSIVHNTSADKKIMDFHYAVAGTSTICWPCGTSYPMGPFIAKAGDKIVYTWGAAQTTPEVSLQILEVDAP